MKYNQENLLKCTMSKHYSITIPWICHITSKDLSDELSKVNSEKNKENITELHITCVWNTGTILHR